MAGSLGNAPRADQLPPSPWQSLGSEESGETDFKSDERQRHDHGDARDKAGDPRRPTRFLVDPAGELTHDETTVDVVTVPCPGGHRLHSWSRDGLMGRYFGAPSMREAAGERPGPGPSNPSWVRQGIRREAPRARILLYEHPPAKQTPKMTLAGLADALLAELHALRGAGGRARPVIFVAHSVGGLVVKMALTKASRDARYEGVLRECYGVAFFGMLGPPPPDHPSVYGCSLPPGTPHQGSSYFAMSSLAPSIQALLRLSSPLPASITDALRVGNSLLQRVDEDFKAVSNDVRVWTFYETIESRLSGAGGGSDVYFTAPLTSIKSAVLGMRQETIFALQSDHANIASFGRHNVHSLRLFLRQLAVQIGRADMTLRDGDGDGRWTLGLEQKVNVEVHGFFDDPPAVGETHEAVATIRAWSTRLPLKDFLKKGPEVCLSERLNEVDGAPQQDSFLRVRGRTSLIDKETGSDDSSAAAPPPTIPMTVKNVLGIKDRQAATRQIVTPGSPIIQPVDAAVDASHEQRTHSAPTAAPRGLASPPSHALLPAPRQVDSPPVRPPSLIQADLEQELAIDRLSPPLRPRVGRSISRSFSLGSDRPRLEYREFIALSPRSRSALNDASAAGDERGEGPDGDDDDGGSEASPRLPEAVLAIRKMAARVGRARGSDPAVSDETPAAAFARPGVKARRFVWVHVPFNNPTWVKVSFPHVERTAKTLRTGQDVPQLGGPADSGAM